MEKESNGVLRDPALERISVHMRKAVSMNRSELGELKALVCRIRKERHQSVSSLSKQQQLFIRKQSRVIPSLLQPSTSRKLLKPFDSGKDGEERAMVDCNMTSSTSCPSLPALVPLVIPQSSPSEGRVKGFKGRSSKRHKGGVMEQEPMADSEGRKRIQPFSSSTSIPSQFCPPPTGILSSSVNHDHQSDSPLKSEMDSGILRLQQITVDESRVVFDDHSGQQWNESRNYTHAERNSLRRNTKNFCGEQSLAPEEKLKNKPVDHNRNRSLSEVTSESGLYRSVAECNRRKSALEYWKTVRDSLRRMTLKSERGSDSPLERMHREIRQCRYIRKHPKQEGDDEKDEISLNFHSEYVQPPSSKRCPCYLCATSKIAPLP